MKTSNTWSGRTGLFLLFPFLFFIFTSCEVEFSPNAEWKETPVVYCLLDQDEDTTWVRVEKCYLGEGDIYSPGLISDSINYPDGVLNVKLYAIRDDLLVDSIDFNYTLRDHNSGNFAYQQQPLYWANTRRRLREDCFYRLVVRRTATGDTLAWAETPLIVKTGTNVVTYVNRSGRFGFYINNVCEMRWRALTNARLYQPFVRFYYTVRDTLANGSVRDDTLYVDTPCSLVRSRENMDSYSTNYHRDAFLNTLREALKDDPRPKGYPQIADIYITACSEDLNAYINSVSRLSNIDQGREAYTNIHGGIGVFAARRTHIYKRVECDPSDNTTGAHTGLHALLKSLGVGFI